MSDDIRNLAGVLYKRCLNIKDNWEKLNKQKVNDDFFYDFTKVWLENSILKLTDIINSSDNNNNYDKNLVMLADLQGMSQRINYLGRYLQKHNLSPEFLERLNTKK